ncbi:MAG: hypothetical protein JWR20_2799 [Marmoricola sp.]|nr:hypothetical protein [Marmoricola sp.]
MTGALLRRTSSGFAVVLLGLLTGTGPAATAADQSPGASIDHAQPGSGSVRLLVSVPPTGTVDLTGVKVVLGGRTVASKAASAATSNAVQRTTILAVDTSDSMRGPRIAAAKRAAATFLSTAPANVKVGVVTFDDRVRVLVPPTLDRAAARAAVDGVTLTRNTALYAGVLGAVKAAGPSGGSAGQRSVLVLSDGKDTTSTSLVDTAKAVKASGVDLDVVSLEQGDQANQTLSILAASGRGRVISAANPAALTEAFASEADALARQLVVTAAVPSGSATSADVQVSVPLDSGTVSAQAYLPVRSAAPVPRKAASAPVPVTAQGVHGLVIPQVAVFAGVGAMGLGLVGVFLALALAKPKLSKDAAIAEQMKAYGIYTAGSDGSGSRTGVESPSTLADQARQAAQRALANNASLEAKIAARLEGAGMALKPAEWLMVHAAVTVLAGLFGLLLSGGSILGALLFLFLGGVGAWVYLGFKRGRRLKAFSNGLADTLQLMSGSLSAGLSLAQSIDTIVKEGGEPMTSEFKRVIVESRLGVPLEDSLEGVAQRMESRDFDWVVMAIKIQREVGGNLAELLLTVAATLREREYLRRHVKALSAEGRLSAYVLGGLPPVFLLYLTLSKGDYVQPLYTTPIGWVMCGGMVVMLTVGFVWMMKVAKVDV